MMALRLGVCLAPIVLAIGCRGSENSAMDSRGTGAESQALTKWERFDYKKRLVDTSDLKPLPLIEVQHIRAIIFGNHGRIFQDSVLQRWLVSRPWYHADSGFSNARLLPQERANLDIVREVEAAKHAQVEPGDMRFFQNRVLTTSMLGTHSPQDWQSIEGEVLANHGYVFGYYREEDDTALRPVALQRYFNERYWYEARPDYKADQLSPIEKQNLDTIALAMTRQQGRQLSPGMMHLFQATPISEQMLSNVPLGQLRLLRNEFYALHGRVFESGYLIEHFNGFSWYKPRADFAESELSTVERSNIALIARREQKLHEELGVRLLAVSDLSGLAFDDARRLRNEIYARHGRRFEDPALQEYFADFAWYRPLASFRDDQLNDIERKNVALLRRYETGGFTEG
jgi:hypothetical protein